MHTQRDLIDEATVAAALNIAPIISICCKKKREKYSTAAGSSRVGREFSLLPVKMLSVGFMV